MLQNSGNAEFKKYYKLYEGEKRAYPALANDGGNFIYLSGGVLTDTVQRYNISANEWKLLPSLNQKRNMHASCYI